MALATVDERGLLRRADLLCLPAAGAEPAAARRVDRARHVALEHDPLALALPLRIGVRHGREQRLRVRMAAPCGTGRRADAISTILPRYITATVSEMWRTTERSCAMNRYARPSRSCRSSSRFTTPAWIDTSSADTGSSSTSSAGRARAPGRSRCAGAARPRTRADIGCACFGLRPTSASSSWTRALWSPGTLLMRSGSAMVGPDRHARVERRVRILEDDLHLAAESRAAAPSLSVVQLGAVELDRTRRSARSAAGRSGRWWTCRSPTRRRGRASRRRRSQNDTPETACTVPDRAHALELRTGKSFTRSLDLEDRRVRGGL